MAALPSDSAPPAALPGAPDAGWRLEHTYAALPSVLHRAVEPTPVREPGLAVLNHRLARELGLDPEALSGPEGAEILAGNRLPPGARPLAQAYAGHQYGHFTPLGDGRAILLGEQITPAGERVDIQLKGSGPTPYSRRGDGRAALGPMLREYLISEAMHALGIPTTRSLAVATTGERIWRADGPLPGAVLARVAASHIRVGTFEWAGAIAREAGTGPLHALVEHTLERHFPELHAAENPALALLEAAIGRQATLIARWQAVGFVHGVMNTDNMALSGETIDYGPCAFLDTYDPDAVFSSIDRHGRYAFGAQPGIAQWNLARLAEALLPLLHPDPSRALELATAAVQSFGDRFLGASLDALRRKLGLLDAEADDREMIEDLLAWMQRTRADFTQTFAALSTPSAADAPPLAPNDEAFRHWHLRWRQRLARQAGTPAASLALRRTANPVFHPRNHLVEAALGSASAGDMGPFHRLLEVLARPFDHERSTHAEFAAYLSPAPADTGPYRTFCGT
jgi:uncharacterized protein YdiU (UPF0061 family)